MNRPTPRHRQQQGRQHANTVANRRTGDHVVRRRTVRARLDRAQLAHFSGDRSVYMHDTNHKEFFSADYRFQSSGCTRVEDPRALAAWLLSDNPGWGRREIDAAIEQFQVALRLSPLDPSIFTAHSGMAWAHLLAGRNEEASSWAATTIRRQAEDIERLEQAFRIAGMPE